MSVYYNEIDKFSAEWLRALMAKGLIPVGEVDERSICDVDANDLRGFRQCHFFAGIGGWPYALRLAGFDDDAEVWTGSCPCQPLSVAGKQKGADDERHLWPALFRLISERRPAIIFGEQVAGALGCEWLAGVRADLEDAGYACGAADLCAAGVGAPHIRSRLYWSAVGNADTVRQLQPQRGVSELRRWSGDASGPDGDMADADIARLEGWFGSTECAGEQSFGESGLDDAEYNGWNDAKIIQGVQPRSQKSRMREFEGLRPAYSHWSDYEWRTGADGKARRVGIAQPGLRRLADGIPADLDKMRAETIPLLSQGVKGRVGKLRGYGNAIVPQVAQAFIESIMDALNDRGQSNG